MAARMLLLPLFVVAALLAAVEVRAVEFSIRGFWMIMLEQGEGGNFVKRGRDGRQVGGWGRWGEDRFRGKSCARLQLDAVASEALSGVVYFEIGSTTWGEARKGGAMGSGGGARDQTQLSELEYPFHKDKMSHGHSAHCPARFRDQCFPGL